MISYSRQLNQLFQLDMNSRMTRGQLTDPLAVLDVTSSTVLTPILTEEYTVALCEFFSQELALDSDAVLINYRSLSPELIGFNGHILTENRPFISTDRARFIIGVLGIAFLAFLLQFLKYIWTLNSIIAFPQFNSLFKNFNPNGNSFVNNCKIIIKVYQNNLTISARNMRNGTTQKFGLRGDSKYRRSNRNFVRVQLSK